jgi:hypothetical protein
MLVRYPELRPEGTALSADLFTLGEHRAIYAAWRTSSNVDDIRAALPDELHSYVDRILQRDVPFLEASSLRDAFADCVRRIALRRLSQAKQASTAALSEPDLQPFMSAAVEEAAVLQETRNGAKPDGAVTSINDPRTHELAASLLEDEEMGRKLHQVAIGPRSAQPAEVSPQSEVE